VVQGALKLILEPIFEADLAAAIQQTRLRSYRYDAPPVDRDQDAGVAAQTAHNVADLDRPRPPTRSLNVTSAAYAPRS
jgi:hypothetical protein